MDKIEQGKRNRRKGMQFESSVRKDLESTGWIVAKWTNNIEFMNEMDFCKGFKEGKEIIEHEHYDGKLIPAKRKYNPFMKALSIGTGFPDFIIFKHFPDFNTWDVEGVEAKSNGYLTKEEKEKVKWLLNNHIFSKILVAKKDGKKIIYTEQTNQL